MSNPRHKDGVPPLWPSSIGGTLGKPYGIKVQCYWEHPWEKHIENLSNTIGNMVKHKKMYKNSVHASPPIVKVQVWWFRYHLGITLDIFI
jgi:hypothetical protein